VVFRLILETLNATFVFLHAGTPAAVSQLSLTVMLVALSVVLMGIGFGRISKTQTSLLQHRWTLTAALALSLGAIFLVMVPAAFRYYIDPDLQFFDALSYTTLIHIGIAVPALVTALIYAFGDLPTNVKKWMRVTATLWVATLVLGLVLFLQMLSLI
jgi:uncharacterized membrane protein YozB (DUF420 family)